MENKSTVSIFLKFEKALFIYEDAKAFCISFGASPESFAETDRKLLEIREALLTDIKGGISMQNTALNEHHGFIPEKIIPSAASNTLPGKSDK
jgi:hypothetical protein